MVKKTLILLAIIISICSLAFNVFIFQTPLADFMNNESRLRRSLQLTAIVSAPITRKKILNKDSDDPVIMLMDSTIKNMKTILGELAGASGGLNENGEYINAYGIVYVNSYFYGENYFRNNAIEYFNEILLNYVNNLDSLSIESGVKDVYKITNDYYGGLTFKKLTVAESTNMLQSLCQQILADKYSYLLTKTE